MRGVGLPLIILAIVGLAFLSVSALQIAVMHSYCSYIKNYTPLFDVPRCSSCLSRAYPVQNIYARMVATAWEHLNAFIDKYDALRYACSAPLIDSRGKIIVSNAQRVIRSAQALFGHLASAVDASAKANEYALFELQQMALELERAGVLSTTETPWIDLYNDLRAALLDINNGTEKTALGRAWKATMYASADPSKVYTFVRVTTVVFSTLELPKLLGQVYAPVLELLLSHIQGETFSHAHIPQYINRSVGLHDSIWRGVYSLRKRLLELKDALDKNVERRCKDFERETAELRKRLTLLLDENYAALASFLPPRTYVGLLEANLSQVPAFALSLLNGYAYEHRRLCLLYPHSTQYLHINERLKAIEANVILLKKEVERFVGVLEGAVEDCIRSVKAHNFRDTSLRGLALLELAKVKEAHSFTSKVYHCRTALEYVKKDEAYGDAMKEYEACARRYEELWGEELNCRGTPMEMVACCRIAMERRWNEFISSKVYSNYLQLYDTIFEVAVSNGLTHILLELSSLPRKPRTPEELYKSYSKLLALSDKLSAALASLVGIEWNGYLSTDSVSDIVLRLTNPLPLSAKGTLKIPFSFLGFRVESNGMTIYVEGKRLKFEGSGTANILFQAAPVELEERVLGYNEGHIRLLLLNPHPLPVMTYMPFRLVSYGSGVYYKDRYLYLQPASTAVIERPILEINRQVNGDVVAFIVRNSSPYPYKGTLTFDVNASSGPHYCFLGFNRAVCKVSLSPGEEQIIKFKGQLLERNRVSFTPPEREPSEPLLVERVTPGAIEVKEDGSFKEIVKRLRSYLKKAKELNVADLLPFDEVFLKNVERSDPSLRPQLLPLLTRLEEEIKTEAAVRTKALRAVAEASGDEDLRSAAVLAEKSLLTGDYITALALTRGVLKYLDSRENESGFDPRLLAVAVIVGLVVYTLRFIRLPQKKRRIPRF